MVQAVKLVPRVVTRAKANIDSLIPVAIFSGLGLLLSLCALLLDKYIPGAWF